MDKKDAQIKLLFKDLRATYWEKYQKILHWDIKGGDVDEKLIV